MISCGCPSRSRITCRRRGTRPVLDEQVSFLKARPLAEKEDDLYAVFEFGDQSGTPVRALRTRARARAHARRPRSAAHGLGRLERRHESSGPSGPWGERVARLVRDRHDECLRRPSVSSEGPPIKRIAGGVGPARWRTPPRSTAGTASGTGGHSTTRGGRGDREQNTECRIDSIAQSWAVISGGGSKARAEAALRAVERELIDVDERLVRLLDAPIHADGSGPRVHQGVSAWHSGEWRAVHTRRGLGRVGLRRPGRR